MGYYPSAGALSYKSSNKHSRVGNHYIGINDIFYGTHVYLIQWYETCEAFLLVIPDQNQCFDGTLWTILSTNQLHYSKLEEGEGEGGGREREGERERESKLNSYFFYPVHF